VELPFEGKEEEELVEELKELELVLPTVV